MDKISIEMKEINKFQNQKNQIYETFNNIYNNIDKILRDELIHLSRCIMKEFEDSIFKNSIKNKNIFIKFYDLFVITSILISDKLLNDVRVSDLYIISSLCAFKYNKIVIYKAESILLPYIKYVTFYN